jgi:UDP-N-acetylglucosamine--N-acetylmuramyl-(pentapeptide) pyrophosphoryl-undecaprenol N-acetylglucosamine transferase
VRLLICAGGTGGGVYPALAVHNALTSEHAGIETLWVGGEGGMEARLVERANVPFKTIPAAGVHGVGPRALPGNITRLTRGVFASQGLLRDFRPDALFFTGGYVAVPMALAGAHIPTLLYVPDIEPGLALNTLARFADRIAVTAEDSFRYFKHPERLTLTGYPTRADLVSWKRPEARRTLNLTNDTPVLLVFGGSKGARSINNAVLENLPTLLEKAQIIHITGELDWPTVNAKTNELSEAQATRYHGFPYLHEEMGAALAAADLVVSRAGASVLGEYPLFGLPAILVPYPYAWRYQKGNADFLVQRGAAVLLEDANLSGRLLLTVAGLLGNPDKLAAMREAMRAQSHPGAAAEIGRLLLNLIRERR